MENITQYIARKYLEKEKDKIEDALLSYGTVIFDKNTGRVLTLEEMESLNIEKHHGEN